MMGKQPQRQARLFYCQLSLENRIPHDHMLRKIQTMVDFDFTYGLVQKHYGLKGNVSVPPPVILKLKLLLFLYDVPSERALMWQAANKHERPLHRLSFAGTVAHLNALAPYLWVYRGTDRFDVLFALLLEWIARDKLPLRPNRIEPRAVKRRPKEYDLLNKPRHELRHALLRKTG